MARTAGSTSIQFQDYGLSAFTIRPDSEDTRLDELGALPPHTHLELELHFVEMGAVTLDFTARQDRVGPGELVTFWGGIPHRSVDPDPATIFHVAHIPIVNVLTWANSADVLDRLLGGSLLKSAGQSSDWDADRLAFARWSSDLKDGDPRLRTAVEMEVQARLLRLFHNATPTRPVPPHHKGAATTHLVAKAIHFITRHFVEDISVGDVANAVERNHDHLMESFRRVCGLSLWDFVTRLRLSEAQRLLIMTDLPILTVCYRSGFSSISRMYEAFHRHHGQTPAAYRRRKLS